MLQARYLPPSECGAATHGTEAGHDYATRWWQVQTAAAYCSKTAMQRTVWCSMAGAMALGAGGDNKEPAAKRPSTALGIESSPEEFTCWSDPSSPGVTFGSCFGPQASISAGETQASQSSVGSEASKRLSFSFNMAPAAAASKVRGGSAVLHIKVLQSMKCAVRHA
jgi:hypothetical protein